MFARHSVMPPIMIGAFPEYGDNLPGTQISDADAPFVGVGGDDITPVRRGELVVRPVHHWDDCLGSAIARRQNSQLTHRVSARIFFLTTASNNQASTVRRERQPVRADSPTDVLAYGIGLRIDHQDFIPRINDDLQIRFRVPACSLSQQPLTILTSQWRSSLNPRIRRLGLDSQCVPPHQ